MTAVVDLMADLRTGDQWAVSRVISLLEDRGPNHRELVAALYEQGGNATVVGVTGSPGVGKSTLVDQLVTAYRSRGETVGIIAVDPSSPFTGGALLGDRIRVESAAGDNGVFLRSMSARGASGGLAAATLDAVHALSVAGFDRVVVETVGAGQGEVDVAKCADTVVVVTQPASGDDVQALKAGILEIGDVLVVNKADRPGADRTVMDLREMVSVADGLGSHRHDRTTHDAAWSPPVVETVATAEDGIADLLSAIDDHNAFLDDAGLRGDQTRRRTAAAIRAHVDADVQARINQELADSDGLIDQVLAGETDPLAAADELLEPPRSYQGEAEGRPVGHEDSAADDIS